MGAVRSLCWSLAFFLLGFLVLLASGAARQLGFFRAIVNMSPM